MTRSTHAVILATNEKKKNYEACTGIYNGRIVTLPFDPNVQIFDRSVLKSKHFSLILNITGTKFKGTKSDVKSTMPVQPTLTGAVWVVCARVKKIDKDFKITQNVADFEHKYTDTTTKGDTLLKKVIYLRSIRHYGFFTKQDVKQELPFKTLHLNPTIIIPLNCLSKGSFCMVFPI